MANQTQLYDPLVDAFYKALRQRQFEQMDKIIERLRSDSSEQLQYDLWADYFAGILAEERDRNWALAEATYLRLLDSNGHLILRAHVWLSLGIAYDKQARWVESVKACEASMAAWESLGYPVRRAMVSRQIAISYRSGFLSGEFEPDVLQIAAQLCREALQTLQEHLDLAPEIVFYKPDLALYISITWYELGYIEVALGNWPAAIAHFQQFLKTCDERQDRYHAAYAYWNLGDAYQMYGATYWAQSAEMYQRARVQFQEYNDTYAVFNVEARLASLYVREGNLKEAVAHYDRSLALIETMRTGVSSESARSGFFATVINIYANAIQTQTANNRPAAAYNYIERARARSFFDSLNTDTYTDYIDTNTLSLQAVQQNLPSDAIILEFFTTGLLKAHGGRMTEQQAANNVLYPLPQTLLYAVTKDELLVYDLELSPNTLISSNVDQPVEQLFLSEQIRQRLYQKLIAPAAHLLQNKRRLYIIPHGPLHYVPFHALIRPDGDTLLCEEGPEIVYAPSATILFRAMKPPSGVAGTCLAVGYNGDDGWQLRFAEDEAVHIAHMAGGQSLVGETSKKDALYAQAPNYQALHFSCHGEFDPDSPLDSRLHIGPNETLTGQEIMDNLRLHCNLVTLSACESGLSRVQRGDELYGLIRAFMYAGAPAIIATLWRVDERSTLIFAQKFYELVQQGMPYATALKAAQLYLRNLTRQEALEILTAHIVDGEFADALLLADKYLKGLAREAESAATESKIAASEAGTADNEKIFADPRYWAPFVLIGDPHIERQGVVTAR